MMTINNEPQAGYVEFGFMGFELADGCYELENGITLRRVEYPLENNEDPFLAPFKRFPLLFLSSPSVIIGCELDQLTSTSIFPDIHCLQRLFLLLGRGSVQITQPYRFLPKGETQWRQGGVGCLFHTMSAMYRIEQEVIPEINEMINTLLPKLRMIFDGTPPTKQDQPIVTALKRYLDAIVTHIDLEDVFIDGITCLESLFLKDNEKNELKYRVSNRLSLLLSNFDDFHPLAVRNELNKAYNVRNTVAHGGYIPRKDRKELLSVNKNLQNYNRWSIQICLQLHNIILKNKLIDLLDDSLVDQGSREKLRKLIKEDNIRLLSLPNVE